MAWARACDIIPANGKEGKSAKGLLGKISFTIRMGLHLEGREMGGRWEWGFKKEGIYVYLWLIHVEV